MPRSPAQRRMRTEAVLGLPIKPYALGPDLLFPIGHLDKAHRLSWQTKGSPKQRKLFVEREEENGFKQLIEFSSGCLSRVTTSSSTLLELRFNARKTLPCGFYALCADVFSSPIQWDALDSSERVLTLVMDDDYDAEAFEELLSMLHEGARASNVTEMTISGSVGDVRREEFIAKLYNTTPDGGAPPQPRRMALSRTQSQPRPPRASPEDVNNAVQALEGEEARMREKRIRLSNARDEKERLSEERREALALAARLGEEEEETQELIDRLVADYNNN